MSTPLTRGRKPLTPATSPAQPTTPASRTVGPGRSVSKSFVVRNYVNPAGGIEWACILHSVTDKAGGGGELKELIESSGAEDGEVIEVTVKATGTKITPARRWVRVSAGEYRPIEKEVKNEIDN